MTRISPYPTWEYASRVALSDEYRTEMGQNTVLAPSDTFIRALRSALNHLYDPDTLRQNRLAVVFGVANRFDTPSALQNILTRAIEQLKPRSGAPNRAHAQGIYDLLLYRYVQQVNQEEIANQLGISVRHFRRQQNLAVYELACTLWKQYDLASQESLIEDLTSAIGAAETEADADRTEEDDSRLTQELDWLKGSAINAQTDLALAIPKALDLIQPLLEQNRTQIILPAEVSGLLVVHPVAFQQILLGLLSFAARVCRGQPVWLELTALSGQQELRILGNRSPHTDVVMSEEQRWLETIRQLVSLSQGTFTHQPAEAIFQAAVSFRSVEPVMVLVIDDNPEIITMMQRFAAETVYQVIGISDPQSAIDQALKIRPKLIVLDIMMPQVDGLQVLSRFKHHPDLGSIPVIICSVMPQKDLAAALGASGFLSKPFQREPFIAALDRVMQG